MDTESVEAIVDAGRRSRALRAPEIKEGKGFRYLITEERKNVGEAQTHELKLTKLPHEEIRPEKLVVHTLSGLADYIKANRDGLKLDDCIVHVVDHQSVYLVSKTSGEFHQRTYHAQAAFAQMIGTPACNFNFGHYYSQEDFIVALQALFVESDDRKPLTDIVGHIQAASGAQLDDTGTSQAVTVNSGAHFGKDVAVPNPATLRPFRTFRDVEQPASKFVVRLKGEVGKMPTLALFEADGGAWKLLAIEHIAKFLTDELTVDGKLLVAIVA